MLHEQLDPKSDTNEISFAALLESLGNQARAGTEVTLGSALDQAGARMHGVAILLFALPDSIPLPIPSAGAILGVPLMIISAHLALYGERGSLPLRARRIRLPLRMIESMIRFLAVPLRWAESRSYQRLPVFAKRERLVGVVCLLMSLLLVMPIPLMNAPPAIAIACMSWGLVQRDGVFVGIGIAVSIGVLISILIFADLILNVVTT